MVRKGERETAEEGLAQKSQKELIRNYGKKYRFLTKWRSFEHKTYLF